MRLVELFEHTWAAKYANSYQPEIRDAMLLMDAMFLKFNGILSDESVNVLAGHANVHPSHVGKILLEHDKQNAEILAKHAQENEARLTAEEAKEIQKDLAEIANAVITERRQAEEKENA